MILKIHKENIVILCLVFVHALLLFWHFNALPFSHDELSAIYRCRFENINDLIQFGVRSDGHPAGVQLWLWYYVHLFGTTEWVVKLPFAIASLACSFLVFKCSIKWFKIYAATLSAIIFISLEFFLTQQSYIRPYTVGLFANLAMFYYSIKVIENNAKIANYIGLLLFATLSYYTHYFSFLQSMVCWFAFGVFYFKSLNFKYFILSFICSLILFIPHISITIYQLSMGGLGWLGKPEIGFIPSFYYHLFNQSLFYCAFVLVLFTLVFLPNIFSVFLIPTYAQQPNIEKLKTPIICKANIKAKSFFLFIWLCPLVVLWIYSAFKAPLLQAAALYFSTPFLIILLGNGIHIFKNIKVKICILLLFVITGYLSLVFSAHFFQKRKYSPIQAFIAQAKIQSKKLPADSTAIIWQGNRHYFNFYNSKAQNSLKVVFADTCKSFVFTAYKNIICNELPPSKMNALNKDFNSVIFKDENYLYTCYVLGKNFSNSPLSQLIDNIQFNILNQQEWSEAVTYNLQKDMGTKFCFLELMPQNILPLKNTELVMEIYHKNTRIDWRSVSLQNNQILSAKLKDIIKTDNLKDITIKLFVWNKNKLGLDNLNVKVNLRADNPYEYTGRYFP